MDKQDLDFGDLQKIQQELHQNKQLIEELEEKLRYQELQFKKKEIELNNELAREQNHVEDLKKTLQETSQVEKFKQIADELEEKLASTEEEVLNLKEKNRQQVKEIQSFEKENFDLKSQLSQRKNSIAENHQPNRSSSSNNVNIDAIQEEDEYAEIDKAELIGLLAELTKQKEEVEQQAEKIKQGAIDTIMEKERKIIDLQELCDEQQNQLNIYTNNHDNDIIEELQNHLDNVKNELEIQSSEFQHYREDTQIEQNQLQDQIDKLYQKIEQQEIEHEETIYKLEKEIQERHFDTVKDHESSTKIMQQQYMKQVDEYEKKYKKILVQYQELTRNYESIQDEKNKGGQITEKYKKENIKLQQQCEDLKLEQKKLNMKLEEAEKKNKEQFQKKEQELKKQKEKYDEQIRKLIELDTELKSEKELNEEIKQQNKELNDTISQMQEDYEQNIKSIKEQRDKDFSHLQKDLKQIQKNGGESNLQQEFQQASTTVSQVSDFSNGMTTPQKDQTNMFTSAQKTSTGSRASSSKKFDFESLRSPRTNIKLQFNEYQKDIKQLKEERRVLEEKNDELEQEIQILLNEKQSFNDRIHKLENSNGILQEEIDGLQKEMKDFYKSRQESRKNQIQFSANNKIDLIQQTKLIEELDETRQHLKKIETHLLTYKLQHVEDKNYLEEELFREKRKNEELTEQIKEVTSEKEYLSLKYRDKKNRRQQNLSSGDLDLNKKTGWSLFNKSNR